MRNLRSALESPGFWLPAGWMILTALWLGVFIASVADGQTSRHKALSDPADCTSLTGGEYKANQFCFEIDDERWFVCKPTAGDCDTPGEWVEIGAGEWTDTGTALHPTETTDDVVIGATSPVSSAKLSVDGDADQIQVIVQGNGTQTANLFVVEKSDGSDLLAIDVNGGLFVSGVSPSVKLTPASGSNASIFYRDSGASQTWEIFGNENVWYLQDDSGSDRVIEVEDDAANNSIFIADESGSEPRVGINLEAPLCPLHISEGSAGAITPGTAEALCLEIPSEGGMAIYTPNTGTGRISFGDPDAALVGRFEYDHSADAFEWHTASALRMTLDADGNLGIGTLPQTTAELHIKSVTGEDVNLRLDTTDADSSSSDAFLVFLEAGVIKWSILNDGDDLDKLKFVDNIGTVLLSMDPVSNFVGIGTSSPDSKLHVIGGLCVEASDSGCAATAGTVIANDFVGGVVDTTPGTLVLFGDTTASKDGGRIDLELAADHDTTFNEFTIRVVEDELLFEAPAGTIVFSIDGATGDVTGTINTVSLTVDADPGDITLPVHIPPGHWSILVDTFAAGATTTLEHILGLVAGDIVYLSSVDAARDITLDDSVAGTGIMNLAGSANFTLANPDNVIHLRARTGTIWSEVSRSTN